MKMVVHDGTGYENPDFESHLKINLSICLGPCDVQRISSCTPVWSSENWEVIMGETDLPPLLEECLKKMRKSEIAAFRIQAERISQASEAFHIPPLA